MVYALLLSNVIIKYADDSKLR